MDRTVFRARSEFDRAGPDEGVCHSVKERERVDGAWATVAFGQLTAADSKE